MKRICEKIIPIMKLLIFNWKYYIIVIFTFYRNYDFILSKFILVIIINVVIESIQLKLIIFYLYHFKIELNVEINQWKIINKITCYVVPSGFYGKKITSKIISNATLIPLLVWSKLWMNSNWISTTKFNI